MDEVTKLKARAYDLTVQIQALQNELVRTNQQIVQLESKASK